MDELQDREILPMPAFVATGAAEAPARNLPFARNAEGGEQVQESYVNLIPTAKAARMSTACVQA